jgi:hypothetical protein
MVGDVDENGLGIADGKCVGSKLGCEVGLFDGRELVDGGRLGLSEGLAVGGMFSRTVGASLGMTEGFVDGAALDFIEGLLDGSELGKATGIDPHDGVVYDQRHWR